jgi:hypothetical protein
MDASYSDDFDGVSLLSDGGSGLHIFCVGVLDFEACAIQGSVSFFAGIQHIDRCDEPESDAELSGVLPGTFLVLVGLTWKEGCQWYGSGMVRASCVERILWFHLVYMVVGEEYLVSEVGSVIFHVDVWQWLFYALVVIC